MKEKNTKKKEYKKIVKPEKMGHIKKNKKGI
jgi:hypothetical protein